jgi:Omp85 superfamily domain
VNDARDASEHGQGAISKLARIVLLESAVSFKRGDLMGRSPRQCLRALATGGLLAISARAAGAQQHDTTHDTTDVRLSPAAQGAAELYNAPDTKRVNGAFDVPASTVITGDVAVLNGPVTIAGRIDGSLVAINADVRFAPGARIGQKFVVVGGSVVGADSAHIDGETLKQLELLRYHFDGDKLVAEREPEYDETWWKRHHQVLDNLRHGEAYTEFFYVASQAYNRVEGWSILVGPRFQRFPEWGKINIEAFGVVRSASPVQWGEQSLGHDLKGEVQFGKPIGVALGARAFDVVEPTENWQLENGEVGLASVVLHRDYRDYYGRHGGEGFVRLQGGNDADLTFSLSNEQWSDEPARDPWTLFRDNDAWRPNPFMDYGGMHLFTTRLRVDTREREGSPWSGWYLVAEVEQGSGNLTRIGAPFNTDPTTGAPLPTLPEPVNYSRGFLDARRYNRISPNISLNLRLVAGGWLGGDELPTERRFSLGGPGTLPGYDFRQTGMTPDVLQCSKGVQQIGTPGQCDRIALMQVELRGRFLAGMLRDDASDDWWRPGFNGRMQWVLFTDAGRGWLVGPQDGGTSFPSGLIPPFSTFLTDVGAGVDFGGLGVYAAKAISASGQPVQVIVRLARRF